MITVFGEGRGLRVVWLLEEMKLAYRLRSVDLIAGVEDDAEFLAVNPAGFIPAIQDGVDRDHGVPDGSLRTNAAGARPARSDLPRLPTVSPPRRSWPRGLDLLRRRRAEFRARGRTGKLERRPSVRCSKADSAW